MGELYEGWAFAISSLLFERVGNTRLTRTTRILELLRQIAAERADEFAGTIADCGAMGLAAELANYNCVAIIEYNEYLKWHASSAFAMDANHDQAVATLADACWVSTSMWLLRIPGLSPAPKSRPS